MKVRCQQCGNRFVVKPEKKKGRTDKASGGAPRQAPKGVLLLLFVVLVAAGVLVLGPEYFPDLIPQLF